VAVNPASRVLASRFTTPDIRGGKPCIKGTRITVYDILEYMAGGMSETEILKPEHLRAVLVFAAQRERRMSMGRPYEIAA